jgi:SAM-dependent methyltransferase
MKQASFDWTSVDRNPVSPNVIGNLQALVRERRAGRVCEFMPFLKEFVSGRTTLDIGVVDHDITHIESPHWKHKYIREWAGSVLGVDILAEEIAILQARGYDIVNADATSDFDLGRRFERVVIGDVIEHVDNPVKLLQFAARHVTDDGLILASTPNPYWWGHILGTIRHGSMVNNAEHVAWITPCMAVEIGRRAQLELDCYWQKQPHGSNLVKKIGHNLRDAAFRDSELFTDAFIYIFRKKF